MRFFVNEATSIDFNFLALDSTIDDGEELFNPLNPSGASEILDIYNLTDEDDVARMALALDALVADGSISSQSLQLPNPIAGGGGGFTCAELAALGSAAGVAGVTAATLGCDALIGGTGASYLGLLTSNPDAGDLLPFLLIGLTDTGMIANYQGRNLSRGRWVADSDAFAALPLPWLAADYLVPLGGTRTPYTSELDYNIAVNHSMAVMSGMLDLKLTYSHKGDTNGDLFDSPLTYVPEQDYLDLYGNWTPNDGDYYVGFYIKNLEDSRNLAGSRTTSEMVGGPANLYFTQPRTAGLTFGLNF